MKPATVRHGLALAAGLGVCLGLFLSYLNPHYVGAWVALWSMCG